LRHLQFVSGLFDLATGFQRRSQVIMSSRVLRIPCNHSLELANRRLPISGVCGQPS
jgi:hypothetical protein